MKHLFYLFVYLLVYCFFHFQFSTLLLVQHVRNAKQ